MELKLAAHVVEFLRELQLDSGGDPKDTSLTFAQWRSVAHKIKRRYAQADAHFRRLDRLFDEFDVDKSGTLEYEELQELLKQIDRKLTSLPATAQRAAQQGKYLGHKLNKIARMAPTLSRNEVQFGDVDDACFHGFQYHHLGSLAYIGNAAVFDVGAHPVVGGLIAMYAWRSVYFSEQVSVRTRILLMMDWARRAIWGRDLSRL